METYAKNVQVHYLYVIFEISFFELTLPCNILKDLE